MNKVNIRSTSIVQCWFFFLINFIICLFIGCLGCLVISVIIVAWYGEQTGCAILQNLIQQDLHYILKIPNSNTSLSMSVWLSKLNLSMVVPKVVILQPFGYMQGYLHTIENMFLLYFKAILLGLNILSIRLYFLLRFSPVFFILGLVGFVDGLAQRNIRRASAARESALIYHQAKSLIYIALMLGIFIYLVLPIQMERSEWILFIASTFFAFSIQVTTKNFKKYL